MKLFRREKYLSKIRPFYHENDLIKVITGVRRCGKSSILQIISEELIESGVDEKSIIYINLDKKGYKSIRTADQLETTIDELAKDINDDKYLFVDEIQNVKDFETLINGYREEGDYSIFITGSNSYLLSGELVTKLTGRYLEFEIYTLSFDEYLEMKSFYKMPIEQNLSLELEKYLKEGGFPRTLFFETLQDKRTYVEGIVNEIFIKDVKKRVIVKNKPLFDIVRNYVINNYGCTTSINNIIKGLKSNGLSISKPTLLKYMRYLVDAKLLYECDRFDMKSKRMLSGEKKYYLADLALSFITNPDSRINYGPALENIVYIYAKSFGYDVSVGRIGKLECDFILKDRELSYSYVQVAYSIMASIETENREYAPLEKIHDNYPKYVLTTDFLIQKRNGIKHANIIDFMKSKSQF